MKEQITLFKDTQLKHLMLVKRNVVDAKATDLYIIQGGDLYSNGNGSYWTRTSNYLNSNRLFVSRASFDVYDIDNYYYIEANSAKIGVRPIMSLSEINKSKQNLNKKRINGITEIEYGEYPQSIEDEKIAKETNKKSYKK